MHNFSRPLHRAVRAALFALPFALAAVEPAHAAAQSSASITGMAVTLTDLDPNDGITPSISFYRSGSGGELHYFTSSSSASGVTYDIGYLYGKRPFAPFAADVTMENTFASASFTSPGGTDGINMAVSGRALGGYAGNASSYAVDIFGPASSWAQIFALSANTAVSFTALLDVSLTTDWGLDVAGHFDIANAGILMATGGPNASGGHDWDQAALSIYSGDGDADCDAVTGVCAGQKLAQSGWYTVSYTNATASSVNGDFSISGSVFGASNVTVPEPATNALMALGLLALGTALRRRARGRP